MKNHRKVAYGSHCPTAAHAQARRYASSLRLGSTLGSNAIRIASPYCGGFQRIVIFPYPARPPAYCHGASATPTRVRLRPNVLSKLGPRWGVGVCIGLWGSIEPIFFTYVPGFTPEVFETVRTKYEQYSFWVVFSAGFTPIPYKVFTLAAGVFGINLWIFLLASGLSRSARFFLVGFLIWRFGVPVKTFIDRYFNLLSVAFVILLILGFSVIKLVL